MESTAHAPFKALLVELVEAGMEVSREMMVGVRKATDHDQRIAYAAAHDRAARSVRLSISLHERLERAEREAAREDAVSAQPLLEVLERRVQPKLDLKKAQVRAAVRRSIEQEHEGEDAAMLDEALEICLSEQATNYSFMDRSVSQSVEIIRKSLRLPPTPRMWLPPSQDEQKAAGPPPGRPANRAPS
ncbi:hypothetical protein [Phenylobacterium immobile]|uniref:hypothetical protein n=1 Tax=Phenylobacterium immobile TaxID=21 RepID=UPI000B81FE88|nr:hypothetical protein [Phenylobacterium immobile]